MDEIYKAMAKLVAALQVHGLAVAASDCSLHSFEELAKAIDEVLEVCRNKENADAHKS